MFSFCGFLLVSKVSSLLLFSVTARQDLANKPAAPVPGSKELAKLHELEDIVAQQDNSLAAMSLKLKASQTETAKWKDVLQRTQADHKQKKER